MGGPQQRRAQEALDAVLTAAATAAGMTRMDWTRQPAGDGEVALLPPGIDEPAFVAGFVRGLKAALYEHNARFLPEIRLRVAVGEGLVWMAPQGFAGNVVIDVARLCDAGEVRRRLRESPNAQLVLVVSDSLYRDIQGFEYHDLPPHSFEPVDIVTPEKGFSARAWVHIDPTPGGRIGSTGDDRAERAGLPPDDEPAGRLNDRPFAAGYSSSPHALTLVGPDQYNAGRDMTVHRPGGEDRP